MKLGLFALNKDLWLAARMGQSEKVTVAIQAGADVNSADSSFYDWTALHRAADRGHLETVRSNHKDVCTGFSGAH